MSVSVVLSLCGGFGCQYGFIAQYPPLPLTMAGWHSSMLSYSQSQLMRSPLSVTWHQRESPFWSAWLARMLRHKAATAAASANMKVKVLTREV